MKTMTDKEYHSSEGVSSSTLKLYISNSPKKARHLEKFNERTEAMMVGSAAHMLVLQPELFASTYAVCPSGMVRNEKHEKYQKFMAENAGKEILSQSEYQLISDMADAMKSHPIFNKILSMEPVFEKAFFSKDEKTGIVTRCKADILTLKDNKLYDIKTCISANPYIFGSNSIKLGYDLSAAMYIDILRANGIPVTNMVFVLIEKSRPHEIAVRSFDEAALDLGRDKYRYAMDIYSSCLKANFWPGYSDSEEQILLPNHAYNWREGLQVLTEGDEL